MQCFTVDSVSILSRAGSHSYEKITRATYRTSDLHPHLPFRADVELYDDIFTRSLLFSPMSYF